MAILLIKPIIAKWFYYYILHYEKDQRNKSLFYYSAGSRRI